MELFKLGKKRESVKKQDTAVVKDEAVTTNRTLDGGAVSIEEKRKTQISIVVEQDSSMTVSGATLSQTEPEVVVRQIPQTPAEEETEKTMPLAIGAGTDTADEEEDGAIVWDADEEQPAEEETGPAEETVPAAEEVAEETPVTEKTAPAAVSGGTEMPELDPDVVGIIYGTVETMKFDCRVCGHLERSEYVMVEHEDYGPVLCQVNSLVRKSNLSLEKSMKMNADTVIKDVVTAHIAVIGYRGDNGILMTPRTTLRAGSEVRLADKDLVKKVLGLEINPHTDAYIGVLHGHDVPVALNINDLLSRHACILAKTGGGKSYMSGDIIEELMKHDVTCMIIDPHGEYGAMRDKGTKGDAKFGVVPRGYREKITEFAVSNDEKNPGVKQLKFTFRTLEARDILELLGGADLRTLLPPLKKAIDKLRGEKRFYSVRDLIEVLSTDPETRNPTLISKIEYLDEIGVFDTKGNSIDELVTKGKTTVINLKGVSPDIQQMVVKRLSTVMFELRKKNAVPPMMMVVEEAHNYCPQGTQLISSKPLATIASEGRKFGLGLMVISQRPAKIDKNVLSQCGTQIILKVTNPNDVKAIAASIEGLTSGMTDDIQTMPIGMAMVVGAGIESPLLVEVRPRESRHGGSGVKVLEEWD